MKIGDIVGKRRIISEPFLKTKKDGRRESYVTTECECGKISDVRLQAIKNPKGEVKQCKACNATYRKYNIENKRIGKLVAKKYVGKVGGKRCQWKIECDCGNICYINASRFLEGKRLSCGCDYDTIKGAQHSCWKGVGDVPHTMWSTIKHDAAMKNREFSISLEFLSDLFIKQNGRCALTGEEISFTTSKIKTASLDRIDSSKGYTEDNVQWVHKNINALKSNFSENYFIDMCIKVADHYRKNNT